MKENEKDSILFHSPRIAEICLQGLSGQQRTGPVLDISHSEASQKDGKPFPSKAVSDRHILLQRLVKNIYNQSTITFILVIISYFSENWRKNMHVLFVDWSFIYFKICRDTFKLMEPEYQLTNNKLVNTQQSEQIRSKRLGKVETISTWITGRLIIL